MEKWKNLKLSEKIRYIIGIIYVISGFGSIFTGQMTFIAGLFTGLFGLSLLPVVYTKFNISTEKKLHIIIPIVLFLISCMCMPTEETTVPTNNETNNTVNETITNITENTENTTTEENTENQQSEETENTEEEQKQENTTSSEPKQEESKQETTNPTPAQKEETKQEEPKQETTTSTPVQKEETKQEESKQETTTSSTPTTNSQTVYRTPTGKRYHLDPECGGKNSKATTLDDATSAGLTPCQKCAQ